MTPEEQAAMDAAQEKQIRELAAQITQMSKLNFDPMTIRKGIIASVNDATAPPTVSINISGDTSTLVSQVRTLNNYTPLVNQTVLVAKQGTEIFILGSIASENPSSVPTGQTESTGWIKATLSAGSHGGGGSDVYYRRVLDHGSWKMQWRGMWNVSGSWMIASAAALDENYRPSGNRPIACGRNTADAVTVRMDFNSDGTVNWASDAPTLTINPSAPGGDTSTNGSHTHGISDTYGASGEFVQSDSTGSSGSHSHTITVNSHFHGGSISVASPTWVSLNGVEYFL